MFKTALSPRQFVNVASLEEQVRAILADARYVWQTEIWLDPIEKAMLAGEKLSPDHERVVARELVKTSSRMDDMLAAAIDLYQQYDDAGAALASYDTTYKMLAGRSSLSLSEVWREADAHIPKVIAERGFPAELYQSLMSASAELGLSFDGAELTTDKEGILIQGEHPHRILRTPEIAFPRVDGSAFVRDGLLQSYQFMPEKGICRTDSYQALLAMAKHASENYRARARQAMKTGLVPRPTGWDPFTVVVIVVIIAVIVAIIIGILCATKIIGNAQVCNIALTVLGAVITAGICYLAGQDSSFSCRISSGGSDG
jgi:hypothetical protein